MTKQTGTIITIVVAVLALCCSVSCCVSGIIPAAGGGQWVGDFYVEPWVGLPLICLGILVWVVPLLLWIFLVRGKDDTAL